MPQAVKWTLGCLLLIIRQAFLSALLTALHAPADSWNSLKDEAPVMRNGKLAAAFALVLTAAFSLTMGFRQAITIASVTLTGRPQSYSDIAPQDLDKMRSAAEQRGDARMLAFAALHDGRSDVAHQSADRAVSIDPRLTWIYYDLTHRPVSDDQRARDLARLQQWDPENGLIYLAQADLLAAQGLAPALKSKLSGNEPWVQLVARAFDAPQYNSYQRERFDLEREVAREQGSLNPLRLANACAGGRLQGSLLLRRYAEYVLDSANNPAELAGQARRVAALGERIMACPSEVEKWAGQRLALEGYRKLESVSTPEERELIAARAAQLQSPHKLMTPDWSWAWSLTRALRPNAATIQVSFVLIVLAVLTIAGAATWLIIRRGRGSRTISSLFWVSAGALVAASVASYVAYEPYANLLGQAMNPETSPDTGIQLVQIYYSYSYSTTQFSGVYLWAAFTLLLLLALAALFGRKLRRAGGRNPAPSVT
jgi:hypothetical protein